MGETDNKPQVTQDSETTSKKHKKYEKSKEKKKMEEDDDDSESESDSGSESESESDDHKEDEKDSDTTEKESSNGEEKESSNVEEKEVKKDAFKNVERKETIFKMVEEFPQQETLEDVLLKLSNVNLNEEWLKKPENQVLKQKALCLFYERYPEAVSEIMFPFEQIINKAENKPDEVQMEILKKIINSTFIIRKNETVTLMEIVNTLPKKEDTKTTRKDDNESSKDYRDDRSRKRKGNDEEYSRRDDRNYRGDYRRNNSKSSRSSSRKRDRGGRH
ncbi:hypothetical protein ENUP19_0146G0007 [Entamoeba nuttalli]|uniref:Uncharacterized protein n=1 Tax=Entamoeba nuttalli TaxID=412467 RepID=A0ABQ0DKK9_9EUKA